MDSFNSVAELSKFNKPEKKDQNTQELKKNAFWLDKLIPEKVHIFKVALFFLFFFIMNITDNESNLPAASWEDSSSHWGCVHKTDMYVLKKQGHKASVRKQS